MEDARNLTNEKNSNETAAGLSAGTVTEEKSGMESENALEAVVEAVPKAEDKIFRTAFQSFTEEALPFFCIPGKVKRVMPTEITHLEWISQAADYGVVTEEKEQEIYNHFQFQSKNGGKEDLKRFRVTEAVLSYQNHLPVVTNVIFAGNIQKPMKEFTEGLNTYRIRAITMKGYDGDKVLEEAEQKVSVGEKLSKADLLRISLTPLMDGKVSLKDRIMKAFRFTKEKTEATEADIRKFGAIIYTFAIKFLKKAEMDEVKEVINMTYLAQILVDDAVEKNTNQVKIANAKNLLDLLDVETIAERLDLPLSTVKKLKEEKQAAV